MAEFLLPKNSKIARKGRVHRAEGARRSIEEALAQGSGEERST